MRKAYIQLGAELSDNAKRIRYLAMRYPLRAVAIRRSLKGEIEADVSYFRGNEKEKEAEEPVEK